MRQGEMLGKSSSWFVAALIVGLLCALFLASCAKKSEPAHETPVATRSPKPQTPFERDLDYVRSGQFKYVFVFSRRDSAVFTSDDIAYLKAYSPQETNQWISTEGGRRIIAGTNFEFKIEHTDALNKRFKIEDLSGK
jgi:hypothetical protein